MNTENFLVRDGGVENPGIVGTGSRFRRWFPLGMFNGMLIDSFVGFVAVLQV